jgi:hypothetical protein
MPLSSFYVTGGTVRPNAPCYVERQADRDLFEALQNGEFCYILTARQMGKSSLMVRMARRLRDQGAFVAVLDLTASGRNVTPEQWYNGLLRRLGQQLKIEPELDRFWSETEELGPLQRWIEALRRVVLPALRERSASARLFVFIDEIDVVRSLPFSTDEFFAAIRELYNRRALEPDLAMVSFCLLGVAAPQDLIADTRITPFNIGRRIELRDFTPEEAAPLAQGLVHEEKAEEPGAQKQAAAVLKRIIYWTGGHPYLTQRLCAAMAERKKPSRSGEVDSLCRELFLTRKALDSDDNLVYVRERILNSPAGKDALLDLYQSVLRGRKIEDSQTNPLAGELRLAGITRPVNGALAVRNRIYETVFSPEWTRSNMSSAETERQRQAYRRGLRRGRARAFSFAAAAALLLLGILAVEENLRGRFLLGRWMKEQRTAGEKFGSVELAGPALVYHDVEAMYGAAKNLTNLFEKTCPDEKPKTTLPDGRSLCWDHLGLEV